MAYLFSNVLQQSLSSNSALVSAPPFTMAGWLFVTVSGAGLVSLCSIARTDDIIGVNIVGLNNQRAAALVSNDGLTTSTIFSQSTIPLNTWAHVCGVFAATNSRQVFLNGIGSSVRTIDCNPSGMNETRIGARNLRGSVGFFMPGRIADVGIWNVALSQEEITSLARGMTCDKIRPQSLVNYFPLVRDPIDAKGGLTITNNNGATVANHPRVYA